MSYSQIFFRLLFVFSVGYWIYIVLYPYPTALKQDLEELRFCILTVFSFGMVEIIDDLKKIKK